ncbi:flagellin [Clostridium sporogenes]|uniref:flagellin N-terminal helical domain-containing protein n=1 Tax=Clostridium sporogenes TaxID=1509 RepID=UPI0006B28D0C|nr:flagellin [Clostridium sporogenes]KOY65706.1 flagellin [Clostridium sporogenes]NFG97712.1 flagellin [Clostridium sporogenes]NFL77825.1 flagellin [Clostridium sporogenes]
MIINHNLNAMNSHRQMGINVTNSGKAMEKLSSGLRINRAGDDAAGLSISEKMRAQIRGLNQASRNSQDGISLIQTAEGALNETHSILQRMREISVQAANDTNVSVDRSALNDEMGQLIEEIDRIAQNTQFNEQDILKADQTLDMQVGANKDQVITLEWSAQTKAALGEDKTDVSAVAVDTKDNAQSAIKTVNDAIVSVSKTRSKMGAYQNRLEHTIANLDNSAENLQAAESRVRDVDMAKEMMNFSKNNILQQAAQAMLAQANQAPQGVLQLLR